MSTKIATIDRILEAGRHLFNVQGYGATSVNDIAKVVGISKGNLNYYFPTKLDLAVRLREITRALVAERRRKLVPGKIEHDYVEHLLFAMNLSWNNRFLLRDSSEFPQWAAERNAELVADFNELETLIRRIDSAGMFRKDAIDDLAALSRSIWIVSRYWMDYLRESEGMQEICWADQERGIRHHYAILLPCLTATARRKFLGALSEASAGSRVEG